MTFISALSTSFIACLAAISAVQATQRLTAHGHTTDPSVFASNTFDFIIVGGGTAGLALAARLSEDPTVTVGVIEAGMLIRNDPNIDVPFFFGKALLNTTLDWSFLSKPQKGLNNRQIPQNRGKVLGGSSAINYMVFTRASRPEYDSWAALGTGGGWDWNGLMPFFKLPETVTRGPATGLFPGINTPQGNESTLEGRSGPVQVSYNNFYSDIFTPFAESVVTNGGKINLEPDSGDNTGLGNQAHSVNNLTGKRSFALTAFFDPNQDRQNLLVLTSAQATKINFGSTRSGLTAKSVDFEVSSSPFTVEASREVILSAGVLKSPQLLEQSGIGNKTILSQFGIKTLIDMPQVGENLQDQVRVITNYLLKEPAPLTLDALNNNATFAAEQMALLNQNGTGLFAASPAGVTFSPLEDFMPSHQKASLIAQLDSDIASRRLTTLQARQYAIQREFLDEGRVGQLEILLTPSGSSASGVTVIPGRSYYSATISALLPFSRGSVHIQSSNLTAAPLIDPNYVDFSFDLDILVFGINVTRRIAQTDPLASFIEAFGTPNSTVSTEDDIKSFIRSSCDSLHHPIGTCALAPREIGGVVDQTLTVYGTTNLRVVDASIIPLQMATHTQSTTYAIAEKAAAIIKGR